MDYCVRARPGAPVAVPLDWGELDDLESAHEFSLESAAKRKRQGKKLFKQWQATRQSLTKKMIEGLEQT